MAFIHTESWPKCDDFLARLDRYTEAPYHYRTLRGNCLWSQYARNRELSLPRELRKSRDQSANSATNNISLRLLLVNNAN